MCYSEKLDQAGGYQEEHGYVLVGYKVVAQCGPLLMAHHPLMSLMDEWIGKLCEDASHGGLFRDPRSMVVRLNHCPADYAASMARVFQQYEHPVLTPHQLLEVSEGRHGFHVAASERSALNEPGANPFGVKRLKKYRLVGDRVPVRSVLHELAKPVQCEEYEETRLEPPGVLVRVLVPEAAVDETNHAHAMVVIPPGEKETEAEIALCDAYNARMRRKASEEVAPCPS